MVWKPAHFMQSQGGSGPPSRGSGLQSTALYVSIMSSIYKMNYRSIPTSVWSYMIQNTVDVIHITNTRHQKCKGNVKKKFTLTYRYNSLCIDNEEAAI